MSLPILYLAGDCCLDTKPLNKWDLGAEMWASSPGPSGYILSATSSQTKEGIILHNQGKKKKKKACLDITEGVYRGHIPSALRKQKLTQWPPSEGNCTLPFISLWNTLERLGQSSLRKASSLSLCVIFGFWVKQGCHGKNIDLLRKEIHSVSALAPLTCRITIL